MPPRPATKLAALPALLLAPVLALGSACASDPVERPPAAPASAPATTDFGGTDIAWVQLMIPMDEQLLPVLDLAKERGADQRLVQLAGELRSRYTGEIQQLKTLRHGAGLDETNPHAGHKMPGLVDADSLAAIGGAGGAEFDRKVTACLREHLDQLANLARSEITNGTSAAVKDLARQVEASRTAGLTQLPGAP
ncbi:DUF305 domain-containing protein [Dactylosporangium sp. NPDC049742]|uniref:DUF305 domain-containing protein n=1 Tax=Dactylosporangium sp. NPDC049742 TaxID=3154737 RepID=UPI00343B4D87